LAGKATSELWEGEKHFSVVVRLKPGERDLGDLPKLLVASPDGAQVPLSQVARFRSVSGAMNIARENGRRVVSIGVFIRDRDMGSVVKDMKERVKSDVKLAQGEEVSWSGEFENQERAMKRLSWIVPLSIALIFLLLNAFFVLAEFALVKHVGGAAQKSLHRAIELPPARAVPTRVCHAVLVDHEHCAGGLSATRHVDGARRQCAAGQVHEVGVLRRVGIQFLKILILDDSAGCPFR